MTAMDRLRAAAPAPVELDIDRDALFHRIVAGPSAPGRTARPPRRPRRRLAIVAGLAAAAALTAGTAFAVGGLLGWHTDNSLLQSPREWRKLYRDATRELTLPPGMRWPYRTLAPNTVTSHNEPGGMAVGIAQVSWECYWTAAIRAGDTAAARRSQAALADIVRHHIVVAPAGSPENVAPPAGTRPPFEIYASDGGLGYVKRAYARAAAGDPSGIAQSCRANRGDLRIPPVR
jgi:hypothetical protein